MPPTERSSLSLRPAVAADVAAITDLFLAAREAAVPAMPAQVHTPEDVLSFVGGQVGGGREVWVAEDEALVGYAALSETWLDALYVAPDRQRAGIGSDLLDLAKARRPDGFALWVFASNVPARAFYARHGLVELESTDGWANEERAPDVRMAWLGHDPATYLRRELVAVDRDLDDVRARREALLAALEDL